MRCAKSVSGAVHAILAAPPNDKQHNSMKTITACGLVALAGFLPLAAQTSTTTETTEVHPAPSGGVTETKTTTTTFDPEIRTKVVTYFESYKSNPHGLPPGWTATVKPQSIPATWRTARLQPGLVVAEAERPYLMAAPADLVKILPSPRGDVRYYVAGSNVVAIDGNYRVVDSIQVPTITYEDEDKIKMETTKNGRKVEVEVDKDDGEVEVDEADDDDEDKDD